MHKTTKTLPVDEQPYEKCKKYGVNVLTDAELLSIFMRCGSIGTNSVEMCKNILELSGDKGLVGLNSLSHKEFMAVKGVGEVKAIQLQCICELSRRIAMAEAKNSLSFNDSKTVANYYMEDMRHRDKEALRLVLLDKKNHLISDDIISVGSIDASVFSIREIVRKTLLVNATNIILIHNHPSGDPTPSKEDIIVTKNLLVPLKNMEIKLLDHIIIGDNRFDSIRNYINF